MKYWRVTVYSMADNYVFSEEYTHRYMAQMRAEQLINSTQVINFVRVDYEGVIKGSNIGKVIIHEETKIDTDRKETL